jgi:prepilin peptidase CpaA
LALVFPLILISAAASDVWRYTIPNELPVGLAVAFLAVGPLAGLGLEGMFYHGLAGLTVLALGFGLFVLNLIGGGDVKLLAAAAVWTGWGALAPFLLLVGLFGGLAAAVLILLRRVVPRGRLGPDGALGRLMSPAQGVPYGVAIAVAGIGVFPRLTVAGPFMDFVRLAGAQ